MTAAVRLTPCSRDGLLARRAATVEESQITIWSLMTRPLAADRPLAAFRCGGCGVEYPTHLRNRKYCCDECRLLYMVARTGRCSGCHGALPLGLDDRFLVRATGDWEENLAGFARNHEACRRTIVEKSGRLVECGCLRCKRARGEAAPRLRLAHQSRWREVTPQFQKNRPLVLERNGWVCQICGIAIDGEALPFEDRAPAVDHIIRVAEGGGDELDNLRATHRWCRRREHFLFCEDDLVGEAARARFA